MHVYEILRWVRHAHPLKSGPALFILAYACALF
jgi:hypothetical protein